MARCEVSAIVGHIDDVRETHRVSLGHNTQQQQRRHERGAEDVETHVTREGRRDEKRCALQKERE
jgi:hypothetical protein